MPTQIKVRFSKTQRIPEGRLKSIDENKEMIDWLIDFNVGLRLGDWLVSGLVGLLVFVSKSNFVGSLKSCFIYMILFLNELLELIYLSTVKWFQYLILIILFHISHLFAHS